MFTKSILNKSFLILFSLLFSTFFSQHLAVKDTVLMGCSFQIKIVGKDSITAHTLAQEAAEEISRIEHLLSDWLPNTPISQINQNAGKQPIIVPKEVFDITQRAKNYAEITGGIFDITYASMDKIWRFDGSMTSLPSFEDIQKATRNIGYQHLILNAKDQSVFLEKEGMKISFGSIGKAYAADKAKEKMIEKGALSGLINASGDITTWGNKNSKSWRIGIHNPYQKHLPIKVLKLYNEAITTSGDYEKYVLFNDKRYSHIINPLTGYPSTGTISVTVVGENAEICNLLSTSLMILGAENGKKLIKKYPKYTAYLITDQGKIRHLKP
ncbi:FAD:protein FMN transferase [Riemerella anatipestifer]|uniref:FAD:protein FMN transferase n=1 Tax=Riemerella anatipestifer TaxID=34085 RepID=UPI001BD990A1|nr:FAD:protein FMN transferase [Riemerella anatipestifer]MBT0526046.1 FAD:protein FMN transferase [Riemerella anatipestifer]MBT0527913.1 FAD:protein FMN transferase [Riemerella anatipestifer]MBT0529953.1 FAD:protein FMN transferase [Riemerella anatipestifer]MBT0531827.1 FAD:protein FMN transferase [Riemerella anatipestifer]MBT0537583.1 FAD:protein FMN transferase [Riemerella anatipestifer]